jgi:hypothetical protein
LNRENEVPQTSQLLLNTYYMFTEKEKEDNNT